MALVSAGCPLIVQISASDDVIIAILAGEPL